MKDKEIIYSSHPLGEVDNTNYLTNIMNINYPYYRDDCETCKQYGKCVCDEDLDDYFEGTIEHE